MLNFALIIGFLTTVLSILVKVVGFPDQIRKNYKRKSTEGVSTSFYILSFLVYLLWTLHGILQKDMVIVFGQGLGIITTGAVVYQIFLYRRKK
ncbi:MAG: SemiSWEET family transporter [Candidatus Roizmanbacteria bacterium]|nr:SemiSWEET family transporter [Candidatus Roizmanbacteria bacterium]